MEKYKVVIDTNIFVSAFLGSKNAKLIVRDVFTGQCSLIMSQEQLQEIKIVLQRPKLSKYIHPHELDEFISLLSLKTIVGFTNIDFETLVMSVSFLADIWIILK